MSISVGDLLMKLGIDSSGFTSSLNDAKSQVTGFIEDNRKSFTALGGLLTGLGASMEGAFAGSVYAAQQQKEAIAGLTNVLKNVGVSYDTVKNSINAVIEAQVRTTSYSQDEQMAALQQLVLITGDYNLSLKALPTALDLAAAKNMDVSTAAVLLGKAMDGTTTALNRYGIEIPKGSNATEALGIIMDKVTGQAQAMSNPFTQIKNTLGELGAAIGETVLPLLNQLVQSILPIIDGIKGWVSQHQELVKSLMLVVGALGAVMTFVGPLLIALPFLATAFAALTGPIGWVVIAITGLVTVGTLVVTHWQQIGQFFHNLWDNIKIVFAEAVRFIVDYILVPWVWEVEHVLAPIVDAVGRVVGVFKHDWGEAIQSAAATLGNLQGVVDNWTDSVVTAAQQDKQFATAQNTVTQATNQTTQSVQSLDTSIKGVATDTSQLAEQSQKAADKWKIFTDAQEKANASIQGGVTWIQSEGAFVSNLELQLEKTNAEINNFILGNNSMAEAVTKFGEAAVQTALGTTTGSPLWQSLNSMYSGLSQMAPGYNVMNVGASTSSGGYSPLGGYQHGGPIPDDTLLTSLRTLKPYAVAHAGEAVVPKDGGGGGNTNITIHVDNLNVREEADIERVASQLVDLIRSRTGVKM